MRRRVRGHVDVQKLRTPSPFDTTQPGTDEALWLSWLSTQPEWQPDHDSMVVVSPHPDDETLGAAGLMRAFILRGRRVTVISVTDGERARGASVDLRKRRQAELKASLACLGRENNPVQIVRLALPDGEVGLHEHRLKDAIADICAADSLLVAPFEHDGHTDHEAAGRASIAAAGLRNIDLARYPIWAWHHATCAGLTKFGLARFHLDAGLRRCKARAIGEFQSQIESHPDGAIVPAHVLSYFRRPYESFLLKGAHA